MELAAHAVEDITDWLTGDFKRIVDHRSHLDAYGRLREGHGELICPSRGHCAAASGGAGVPRCPRITRLRRVRGPLPQPVSGSPDRNAARSFHAICAPRPMPNMSAHMEAAARTSCASHGENRRRHQQPEACGVRLPPPEATERETGSGEKRWQAGPGDRGDGGDRDECQKVGTANPSDPRAARLPVESKRDDRQQDREHSHASRGPVSGREPIPVSCYARRNGRRRGRQRMTRSTGKRLCAPA